MSDNGTFKPGDSVFIRGTVTKVWRDDLAEESRVQVSVKGFTRPEGATVGMFFPLRVDAVIHDEEQEGR